MKKNYEVRVFRASDIDYWSDTMLQTDSPEKALKKYVALQRTKKGYTMTEVWAKDRGACENFLKYVLSPEADAAFEGVGPRTVSFLRETAKSSLEIQCKDFKDPMGFGDVIPGFEVG